MRDKIILTRHIFEWLIEHLVYIEESADELVNFYYPDFPSKQANMKQYFIEYVQKITEELEKVEVVNSINRISNITGLNEFNFVIIGSQVEIFDLTDRNIVSLKIIDPLKQGNYSNEYTYLSEQGKALLLKEVGSEVKINMRTGVQRFKINSIKLVN